jgi:hypothetical protein
MFGSKKTPNLPAFIHAPDCKLVAREPDFQPLWNEVESGHHVAICQCGEEHYRQPTVDHRVRQDPYDPATSRHIPPCPHQDTVDPAVLRMILTVQDHADWQYSYVRCGGCRGEWQVPYYAAETGG